MPKIILLSLVLTVILLTAYLTLVFNFGSSEMIPKKELETAINQAKYFYNQKKMRGEDFSNGPCLSNALMPGWVVDIVHEPRKAIDDRLENQCSAYSEGSAKHFVELDIDGNFVRAR